VAGAAAGNREERQTVSPQEQALFEARAVVNAHLQVFAAMADRWAEGPELVEQLARLKTATDAYAKLPRPQQKAA
jgi:hypothetical protein